MKMAMTWCLVALLAAPTVAVETNPLAKVIQLIDNLEAEVVAEGKAEEKAFGEYMDWAKKTNRDLGFEIKTLTSQIAKLEASIAESKSTIDGASSAIEDLAAQIAKDEGELASATKVRNEEHANFLGVEKELVESIDMLQRAIGVLSREMSKNPAAFAQMDTSNTNALVQSLSAVIEAAGFNTHDKNTLVAMVQADSENEDAAPGAPEAAAYKSHSGGIVETLEDMEEKADGELSDARKAERTAQHNFDMLKQSLEDAISDANKDMENEKATKANSEEELATAEGDLAKAQESLANAKENQSTTQKNAMQMAADHQASMDGRTAELNAIREARKILKETTGGAVEQSYGFMQVKTRADLANAEIVNLVKKLGEQHHSTALSQLSSQISAVLKMGGADPFAKVKGLITDMIARLEKEAADEATEKAFCDEEMAKTEAKKGELEEDEAKLTAKIDKAAARSAQLKAEVKELQAELAALAKQQAEMDAIRQEQNAAYLKAKEELELGISGVRKALSVLRDYYASAELIQQPEVNFHSKSTGAGQGIISILEVCESDFSKNLAEEETAESDAQAEYDQTTQENKVTKTMKEQDVKYKTQEHTQADKSIAGWTGDRDTLQTELSAVNDYYAKLKDRCIAKPETYEERKARREAEIAGLKQALQILESETAFVQSDRRFLRH